MPGPFVSIVIATRDRAGFLKALLAALPAGTDPIQTEVIVADNASTDGTPEVVAGAPGVVSVRLEQPGKSRALNRALAVAKGRFFAFLDDDEIPAPGWLATLVGFLEESPDHAAAIGRVLPPPDADPALVARAREWRTFAFYDAGPDRRDTRTLLGGNMIARRETFETVGGFNEALGPGASGGHEDLELALRVRAAGLRIGYVPEAVVYHVVDDTRLSDEHLRAAKLRSARSRYVADRATAVSKAVRHLAVDLPAYPVRALLGAKPRRRARARMTESLEVLKLARRDAPRGEGAPDPFADTARPRVALVNRNRSWGGGEKWFVETAAALVERGRPLLLVTEKDGKLRAALDGVREPNVTPDDLAFAMNAYRPAVVACNARKDLQLARRAARRAGVDPKYVLFRGIARPLNNNPFRRMLWRSLSRIVVNSDATRACVEESLPWFPPDRITRIYHWTPFEPAEPVPSDDATFRIGTVGRLIPSKGVDHLLRALALLPDDLRWTCAIAGDGRSREDLEALAKEQGVADRCTFLGHVDDVRQVYARCDAVAIPSLYEGFCFVAVEAALAGLPVVASGVTALAEVVLDGKTGILVPPKDPRALAAALQELANDRDAARALGEAARECARERFQTPALLDAIDATLDRAATEEAVGR